MSTIFACADHALRLLRAAMSEAVPMGSSITNISGVNCRGCTRLVKGRIPQSSWALNAHVRIPQLACVRARVTCTMGRPALSASYCHTLLLQCGRGKPKFHAMSWPVLSQYCRSPQTGNMRPGRFSTGAGLHASKVERTGDPASDVHSSYCS
jgi:hypothetical protein